MLSRENHRLRCIRSTSWIYLKLLLKSIFCKSFRYSKKIYQKANFLTFLKHHIISIFVIIFIPVIILSIFYSIDSETKFEIATTFITYLCTTYLAILVYYGTWKQENTLKFSEAIHIDYYPDFKSSADKFVDFFNDDETDVDCKFGKTYGSSTRSYSNEYKFIGLHFRNLNVNNPIKIKFSGTYLLNDSQNVMHISTYLKTNISDYDWVEYKQDCKYFCGFSSEYFKENYFENNKNFICYFVFEILTLKNETALYIIELDFKKDGLCPMGSLVEKKSFEMLLHKHGTSILKSINTEVEIKKHIFDEIDYLNEIHTLKK